MNHHYEDNELTADHNKEIGRGRHQCQGGGEEERVLAALSSRIHVSPSSSNVVSSFSFANKNKEASTGATGKTEDLPGRHSQPKTGVPNLNRTLSRHASHPSLTLWLQQKKMKRMEEQMQQGRRRHRATSFDASQRQTGPENSGRSRSNLFEELRENGVEEEEASRRQRIYSVMRYVAGGDLVDDEQYDVVSSTRSRSANSNGNSCR